MKTAEEILEKNTGHAYGLMGAMVIKSMKEYGQQCCEDLRERIIERADEVTEKYYPQIKSWEDNIIDTESIRSVEINLP